MAIAFVGTGGWRGQANAIVSPLVPSGSAGDFMVMMVVMEATISASIPANWNPLASVTGGSSRTPSVTLFSRTASPAEPASYTVNLSRAGLTEACIFRYSGGNNMAIDSVATLVNGFTSTISIPSIVATKAPSMQVVCVGAYTSIFDQHFSAPTGATQRFDGPFYNLAGAVFDRSLAVAGTTSLGAASLTQAGSSVATSFNLVDSNSTGGDNTSSGSFTKELAVFSKAGTLAVASGAGRFLFPFPATLVGVSAAVNTAATGSDIVLDVKKNGSSVFTATAQPRITAGAFATTAEIIPDVTAVASGDYITVDVLQIGSGATAGSDLTVFVHYTA